MAYSPGDFAFYLVYVVTGMLTEGRGDKPPTQPSQRWYVGLVHAKSEAELGGAEARRLRQHRAKPTTWLRQCTGIKYVASEVVRLGWCTAREALCVELAHWARLVRRFGIGRVRGAAFPGWSHGLWQARQPDVLKLAKAFCDSCPNWLSDRDRANVQAVELGTQVLRVKLHIESRCWACQEQGHRAGNFVCAARPSLVRVAAAAAVAAAGCLLAPSSVASVVPAVYVRAGAMVQRLRTNLGLLARPSPTPTPEPPKHLAKSGAKSGATGKGSQVHKAVRKKHTGPKGKKLRDQKGIAARRSRGEKDSRAKAAKAERAKKKAEVEATREQRRVNEGAAAKKRMRKLRKLRKPGALLRELRKR